MSVLPKIFTTLCSLFFLQQSENKLTTISPCSDFSSEAELLSYLKSTYDKTVVERDSSLITDVQHLLSAVKNFLVAKSDQEVRLIMAFICISRFLPGPLLSYPQTAHHNLMVDEVIDEVWL